MAVIQISKIQIKRGKRFELPGQPADPNDASTLPNGLDVGEFGYLLDTLELFIGTPENSPIQNRLEFPYRNLAVLTEYSPNLEKLLQYNYRYPIGNQDLGHATDQTGTRVFRPLQERLDEIVSVKAYGAIGDGISDDTYALARAIIDVATTMNTPSSFGAPRFRTLYFPAGTYKISAPIPIPQNSSWIGDGIGKTIILQSDITQTSVAQTVSNQIGVVSFNNLTEYKNIYNLGVSPLDTSFNIFPIVNGVAIHGITFQHTAVNMDVLNLYRIQNTLFSSCEMIGVYLCGQDTKTQYAPYNNNNDSRAINIDSLSTDVLCKNVAFVNCVFRDVTYSSNISESVENVNFFNCKFKDNHKSILVSEYFESTSNTFLSGSYPLTITGQNSEIYNLSKGDKIKLTNQSNPSENGFYLVDDGANGSLFELTLATWISPKNIKISHSLFENIKFQGITVFDSYDQSLPQGVTSSFNTFNGVGEGLDNDCNSLGTPLTPIIDWKGGSTGNSSVSDIFSRIGTAIIPRIAYSQYDSNMAFNTQDTILLPNPEPNDFFLASNISVATDTGFSMDLNTVNTAFLNYSIVYDDQLFSPPSERQAGTLTIISDGISANIKDDNISVGTVNVTFSVAVVGSSVVLQYTNTNAKSGRLYIDQKEWDSKYFV